MRIAHELASWANSALGVAEGASEMTIAAAKSVARSPGEKAAIGRAGEFLRAIEARQRRLVFGGRMRLGKRECVFACARWSEMCWSWTVERFQFA